LSNEVAVETNDCVHHGKTSLPLDDAVRPSKLDIQVVYFSVSKAKFCCVCFEQPSHATAVVGCVVRCRRRSTMARFHIILYLVQIRSSVSPSFGLCVSSSDRNDVASGDDDRSQSAAERSRKNSHIFVYVSASKNTETSSIL
jgi:hypothetical protein